MILSKLPRKLLCLTAAVCLTTAAIADAEFMFGHALTARLRIDDK